MLFRYLRILKFCLVNISIDYEMLNWQKYFLKMTVVFKTLFQLNLKSIKSRKNITILLYLITLFTRKPLELVNLPPPPFFMKIIKLI